MHKEQEAQFLKDVNQNIWEENKEQQTNPAPLDKATIVKMIRSRIRREKKIVMEYFWASFVYQLFIYAVMSHLIIRFWGEEPMMLLGTAGILLYIPFTVILMRKFKAMCQPPAGASDAPVQDIQAHVKKQYALLSSFFRFKKRFEWIAIPVSCLLIVIIIFRLYVPGGFEAHITGAVITYVIALAIFLTALYFENKKRFIQPLCQLTLILEDMKTTEKAS